MELARMFEMLKIQKWHRATKHNTSLEDYVQMCKDQLEGFLEDDELRQVRMAYQVGASALDACA